MKLPSRAPSLPPQEFTARFLALMPPRVAQSFTADQLDAIRKAFGNRYVFSPPVDIRRRIRLPWGKYYLVIQAGRDKRTPIGRLATGGPGDASTAT